MPTSLELLLKAFLDLFSRIFEIGDFVFDHLDVDILGDHKRVLLHIGFHVAEFYVCGNLQVRRYPIFGNPCARLLLFFAFGLLGFLLFCRHLQL